MLYYIDLPRSLLHWCKHVGQKWTAVAISALSIYSLSNCRAGSKNLGMVACCFTNGPSTLRVSLYHSPKTIYMKWKAFLCFLTIDYLEKNALLDRCWVAYPDSMSGKIDIYETLDRCIMRQIMHKTIHKKRISKNRLPKTRYLCLSYILWWSFCFYFPTR